MAFITDVFIGRYNEQGNVSSTTNYVGAALSKGLFPPIFRTPYKGTINLPNQKLDPFKGLRKTIVVVYNDAGKIKREFFHEPDTKEDYNIRDIIIVLK